VTFELLKTPYVRSVAQRAGRAEKADDIMGAQDSEFEVDLRPLSDKQAESAQSEIRSLLAQFPGVNFAIKTFLTERIEETLSGYTASVVINIFGNDMDTLDKKAQEIGRILSNIPDSADAGALIL
ncbi:MAG: heavy metal efflux pump cobalt-zinc-cadmium, partial [bacterium]